MDNETNVIKINLIWLFGALIVFLVIFLALGIFFVIYDHNSVERTNEIILERLDLKAQITDLYVEYKDNMNEIKAMLNKTTIIGGKK